MPVDLPLLLSVFMKPFTKVSVVYCSTVQKAKAITGFVVLQSIKEHPDLFLSLFIAIQHGKYVHGIQKEHDLQSEMASTGESR